MKVVLIGADGMLGHALADVFQTEELIALGREQLDITNEQAVQEKIKALAPAIIINAAAYTDVDGTEKNREAAFAVNATGISNIAKVAKEIGAVVVHYSTDYIFPGDNPTGYDEQSKQGPAVNVYGESKLAGEVALQNSGATYYIIRTAWLYGPYGKNFVDTMRELARTKPELSVVNDQHGSPTFTYDVARATTAIIKKEPGIYHAVNQGTTTWYDFAREIFAKAGLSIRVKPVTSAQFLRPAKRPQYSMLKNTRGPTLRPWEEALDDYLNNYQSKPS